MTRRTPLALVGPTAVGKTDLSLALAESLGAEIVSVDSMLVYRGMDVGTAKPSDAERARVPHHMIDVAEPSEAFSVARFQQAAPAGAARDRRARERRRCWSAGRVSTSARSWTTWSSRARIPAHATDLERQAAALGPERMYERLASMDPVAAARIEPGNVRRIVRALEVPAVTGRPFSSFAEAWERYDADAVRPAGLRMSRELLVGRIRGTGGPSCSTRAGSTRCVPSSMRGSVDG